MLFNRLRISVLVPAFVLASCAGGSHQQALPTQPVTQQQVSSVHMYAVAQSGGASATIKLGSSVPLPDSALDMEPAGTRTMSVATCGSVPPIRLRNPFSFPITIQIVSFTVKLPCTPNSALFGASFYQINPLPAFVSPSKLGDVHATGSTITFTPKVQNFTLAAMTVSQITILPETSTDEVAFPVAINKLTNLTANAPNITSGLQFTYSSVSGATTYSAACFPAFSDNVLAPPLQGVPLVGIPSFYCQITPANSGTITFGQTVTFTIGAPLPDRSIFEPDGVTIGFACTESSSCNVPTFTVPTTYQRFIAGNVQDLVVCVPANPTVDCNNVSGLPQGGTRTTVQAGSDFDVLVADDPTYKPGTESAPVPWDGILRKSVSGQCVLNTSSDPSNGDAPPGYSDAEQNGIGPYAEFDVSATGPGSCTITVSEDPKYIMDYTDPSHPVPRSASVTVTVQGTTAESRIRHQ